MLCSVRMVVCYTYVKMEVVTFIGLKTEDDVGVVSVV